MYKLTPILLLAASLWSCNQNSNDNRTPEPAPADSTAVRPYDPKVQLNLQTRSYSEVDSSGIFMLPLTAGEYDKYRKGEYYKEMPANTYWNIIFYNSRTGATHLLSDRKMLIHSFDCQPTNSGERRTTSPGHIFYYITVLDHNQDQIFNNSDPQYLFVSDKEGRNFRQLSPDNFDIREWQYVKGANKILMLAVPDSDRNQEFDEEDEMAAFETALDSAARPREIVSPAMKQQLKMLYDRDWKRLNRR